MERKVNLCNPINYGGKRSQPIKYIVIHYTGNDGDTDEANAAYFARENTGKTSAHWFVDDDSATLSVPEGYVAYHCGANYYYHPECRNSNSIGVCYVGGVDKKIQPKDTRTEKQKYALVALLNDLRKLYPKAKIYGHHDFNKGKSCPCFDAKNEYKNI